MGTQILTIISGKYLDHYKNKNGLFDFLLNFKYRFDVIREERHLVCFYDLFISGNNHSEPNAKLIMGFNLKSFRWRTSLLNAANHCPMLSIMVLR